MTEDAAARPLLEVRDLHVTYRTGSGGLPAVRGVDLTLARGETVGIAGESGCGKSSLVTALLRLLPEGTTVSGQVLLDGEDVFAMKPGRLRAVRWAGAAIVFQGAMHALNPVRRVRWQVAEAIALPNSSCSFVISSRICACVVTSSAVVGSSAIKMSGSQSSAMAIITRWRMPPENSCG